MTIWVPRLPISLDPLIAEAKRRMRRRRLLVVAILVLLAATAFGMAWFSLDPLAPTHDRVARAGNPYAIKLGMTPSEVRRVAGSPNRVGSLLLGMIQHERMRQLRHLSGKPVPTDCWHYFIVQPNGWPDDWIPCFKHGHVTYLAGASRR